MRGDDIRSQPWNVMVDLFLYRDPAEEEQEVPEEADEAVMQPALGGWFVVIYGQITLP